MRWSAISKLAGVAASLLGLFLLYRVLSRYDAAEITEALGDLSALDIGLALGFATVSFAALACGEILAVRYAGFRLDWPRTAKVSTAAIGIGHAIGLAALSSGAVRYRMYRRHGADVPALAKLMLFSGITVAVGMLSVGGIAMLGRPQEIAELIGIASSETRLLGGALLAIVALYIACCAMFSGSIRLFRINLSLPASWLALGQIAAGATNYAAIAGCLYACLRPFAEAGYAAVAALYVGSDAAAVIGHVPGGWGVLEYVLTAALDQPHLIAGILAFRTIYYLLPLFIGLALFAQDELAGIRERANSDDLDRVPHGRAAQPQ